VRRVVAALEGLGPVSVEERTMTEESISFALPKEAL
ncbi:MAG: hypothetical protein QOH23_2462, partial [Gaiellaceae bacterium]|nr:hypothetical protein [Gaiellaceae bacterium]